MGKKSNKSGTKTKYKITNWKEYNKALENRGNICIWFSNEESSQWYAKKRKKVGSPFVYSNQAIELGLSLKIVFHLGLRQLVGFLKSIIIMMELDLDVPEFSRFSKRNSSLKLSKFKKLRDNNKKNVHVIIDSTGLKIYGEGEWKALKHGLSKRRIWRKLHLAVDDNSKDIISSELTTYDISDPSQLENLLQDDVGEIESFTGDGAYDTKDSYDYLENVVGVSTISVPPRINSSLYRIDEDSMKGRDFQVLIYEGLGRKEANKATAYKRQNIAENAMFRYKQIIGNRLYSRKFKNQQIESQIAVKVLNKMTSLGMPESHKT